LSGELAGNRDTSKAQSFGNSPEKTRTRRRPAIAKEGDQSKTPEATPGKDQAGKASPKAQDIGFAQEVRFAKKFFARSASGQGLEWRRCF
jgi:hypothetical protein